MVACATVEEAEGIQEITPNMLLSNSTSGKAEKAINYYSEVFEDFEIKMIGKYNEAFLIMKKFNMEALEKARRGQVE
jgi:predicted 3-demethylubiquinone-9 3-methyltransferase (glyoxalase superfamily)